VQTRKGKERETPLPTYDSTIADMDMTMDNSSIISPSQPSILLTQPIIKTAKPRKKRIVPKLNYDIVSNVFEQNSNIPVGELLKISPMVKRQFVNALKTPRQPRIVTPVAPVSAPTPTTMQELSFVEDDDEDTTAIYTDFVINGFKIKTLIDGGAAKTCMSQELVEKLGLQIDAPSQSIFTLGNSTKQRGLGLIYDVPIKAGGVITIPGSIEVLPATPTPLIIGNNWLNRAKAVVDYKQKLLSVTYKGRMAEIPINFFKTTKGPTIQAVTKIPVKAVEPQLKNIEEEEVTHDDFETDSTEEYTDEDISSEQSSTSDDDEAYFNDDAETINKKVSFNLVDRNDLFTIAPEPEEEPYQRTDEDLEAEGYDLTLIDIDPQKLNDLHTSESSNSELTDEQLEKIQLGDIDDKVKQQFLKIVYQYQDVFDWNNDELGCTPLIKHRIITEDVPPIRSRPYRMCPAEIESLKYELNKLSELGVIRPSNSPWSSPIILVKKKDNSYRLVIDYRKLNAITKKDAYALPRIETLLDTLGNASIFSALDMRSGFYQVALAEDSIEKSAFATAQLGQWEFTRMPMGLCNSVGTFQRMVDIVFRDLINKSLVAYIDDLNCFSKTHEDHLVDLEKLFNCVRVANLKLNISKCFFFKQNLSFLGYIITTDGLETDPAKIEKVKNFPTPTTVTQIKSFIGIASYYRRFIKNFAAIARPLHNLTKKGQNTWNQESLEAFNNLKEALTTTPVLVRPNFDKPFILVTDASRVGLGCALSQLDENGHEHPVQYISRGLRGPELNYGVSKLEGLAIVWAVKIFRPYLLGKPFTIITDHAAINGLLKSQEPTGILARWITILNEYEYEVKYRPGRVNECADFLSRLGN
jgi:predicted aspartyl protease